MNVDIDSILYIIITIAILAISGLGSRRKKRAQQMQQAAAPPAEQASEESTGQYGGSGPVDPDAENSGPSGSAVRPPFSGPSSNPFEKLEQLLTGQFQDAVSQFKAPVEPEAGPVSMEGESLEVTADEEEMILEHIRRDRESLSKDQETEQSKDLEIEADKTGEDTLPSLFEDVDEIKKAVIYSEILNRKYN